MRHFVLMTSLLFLACQSEPGSETSVEGAGPAGPPPEGGDPGPDGGGPDRDAPVSARLEGLLVHEAFAGGNLQVDVVGEREGTQQVVGMERYDEPGPFRIAVRGDFQEVDLIVYVDVDGDGPSAGDLRVEYAGNPISLVDVEVVEGLTVDLAEAEAQDGTPKDAEEPEATGDEPSAEGDESAGEAAAPPERAAEQAVPEGVADPTAADAESAPAEGEATELPPTEDASSE